MSHALCGLQMSAIELFEQYAKEYDAWFDRNPAAYEAELRAVKAALPVGGSGLEIGVGTGRFAAPLGIRVGVDPSPAMASIARARGIVALGAACELAQPRLGMEPVRQLRDLFWQLLQARFGERVVLNGHPTERLPNTLNVSFEGRIGSEILNRLEHVAASTGSACHSGSVELSPVLKAMRVPPEIGMGAVRFSLGRTTTRDEIEQVVSLL